jgi:hypothetical protein
MSGTSTEETPLSERQESMLRELKRRQDAVEEIERRNQVRQTNEEQPETPTPTPTGSDEVSGLLLSNHGYTFAVVNKAHRGLNPRCKRPGFRILGLFMSEEGDYRNWLDDLREHNQIYVDSADGQTKCKLGALHKLPLLKYMLVPKNESRDRDREYTECKIEAIKQTHLEHLEMAKQEFMEHREKRVQGKMGLSLEKQRENAKEKRKREPREKALRRKDAQTREAHGDMKEVARVPRMLEMRNQNHAIIIVLNDVTSDTLSAKDDPEPAVMVLDTFDTCEDAEKYMNRLKNYVFCMNLDIVDMYVWHFPEDVDFDKVKEKYRNPEQDKVMSEKKNRKQEVENMEARSRMEKLPLPVQEVTAHSKAPENFQPLKQTPNMSYTESAVPVDRAQLEVEARERGSTDECSKTGFYPMSEDINKRMMHPPGP